jgi:putative hydrolase of the HAD superfamily
LAVEPGPSLGWQPYVGPGVEVVGADGFGASAPGDVLMREYGFTVENVHDRALLSAPRRSSRGIRSIRSNQGQKWRDKMNASLPISTLFLDLGGVLLTNGWDHSARRRAAATFSLDYDEMNERHTLTFDSYEQAELTLDEYLNRVIFYEPRAFSRDEFKGFMYAQSQPYPEMIDLVCRLKERHGLKLAALTNEGRELTFHRIQTFGLRDFIDFFIASCFIHIRKPGARIYQMALDIAQVLPAQALYLEDRPLFVEVAQGLGIRSLHHTGYASTRAAMAELGLAL